MFGGNTIRLYLVDEVSVLGYIVRLFPFLVGAVVGITFEFWKKKILDLNWQENFTIFSASNLLFVGIMSFFISRMFAFAVASHRTFGIP